MFELSLWQAMLGTLMTDQKHVDRNQGESGPPSVRLYMISLTKTNRLLCRVYKQVSFFALF